MSIYRGRHRKSQIPAFDSDSPERENAGRGAEPILHEMPSKEWILCQLISWISKNKIKILISLHMTANIHKFLIFYNWFGVFKIHLGNADLKTPLLALACRPQGRGAILEAGLPSPSPSWKVALTGNRVVLFFFFFQGIAYFKKGRMEGFLHSERAKQAKPK